MSKPYYTGPAAPTISAASAAALRTVESTLFFAGQLARVAGTTLIHEWDPANITADNGTTVIKPDDIGPQAAGRWVAVSFVPSFTPEGGIAILLVNKTGVASVKGTVVSASTTTDYAFKIQTDEYDSIGVVYDAGIADGQLCRVVVSGIADVLLKDTTAATHGQWLAAADTDGRALAAAVPAPPATDTHFKEIGHVLQSVNAGVGVLCRAVLHFN